MNWWDRQQRANEAFKPFADIDFTPEELETAGELMMPVLRLFLTGPDGEFLKRLCTCVDGIHALIAEKNAKPVDLKGPIYGVPWIEVEFGQRSEGWALFMDLNQCIRDTKKSAKRGAYSDSDGGGYLGPERPLGYYEIPVEGLELRYAKDLKEKGFAHTDNHWSPKYMGSRHSIKEG
jgi:hypothetical protein